MFLGITVCLLVTQYLLRKEKSTAAAKSAFGVGALDDEGGDVEASARQYPLTSCSLIPGIFTFCEILESPAIAFECEGIITGE